VYRATWNGSDVAVTKLDKAHGSMMADKEIAVMAQLSKHPNLVQLYGVTEDSYGNQHLIMELVTLSSLDKMLTGQVPGVAGLTVDQKLKCGEQVCAGMVAIEAEGLVHCDLAARNCLVQSVAPFLVKLSDFGLSKTYQEVEEALGKAAREIPVRWTAPEVMVNGAWSEKSDVWSFGVLLWEIWSDGDVPFGLVVRCVRWA